MLNTISWQGYWTCIALATIAYYLFLYLIYFRKDLAILIGSPNRHRDSNAEMPGKPWTNTESLQQLSESEKSSWNACMDELEAFFEAQKKSKAVKGEVVFSLHLILQKYPGLRESENRIVISNAIKVQCENLLSISLSDEELKGVWYG